MNKLTEKLFQSIAASSLLLAAEAAASTEDENLKRLTKPQSTINFGAGHLANDNARFGQYDGLRNEGAYGILNIDITKRDDNTGTWLKLLGRNLGLQNRTVRFEHNKQGHWRYFIDFSQTPRYEPFTTVTAVTGIGGAHLNVPTSPTTGEPAQLHTERQAISFGVNRLLPGNFELQFHFRNEEKDGTRIFGRGNRLGPPIPGVVGGYEFLPEPINYSTRQFGGTLNYNGQDLQLSGGYYGTLFVNRNTALYTTGGSGTGGIHAPSQFSPIALPPDNQSHQMFLSGGYRFSPTTHGTFKAAYTRATQTDGFLPTQLLAPGIGGNLGGRIDTALVQGGLTSRPLSRLSVLANVRFEDRDDNTPVLLYNPLAGRADFNGNRWSGLNHPRSFSTLTGKFEANYALPMSFRLIGGVDYEHWSRRWQPTFVGHRTGTDEISYRAEIRRTLADTLTGSIAYIHSDRFGSPFIPAMTATGEPFFNLIAPLNLSDRNRDKMRLALNWEPIEPLSLQVMIDESFDHYGHRNNSTLGLRNGSARNYSLDAVYTVSENLQAVAWFSRNETHIDQASRNWNPADGSREIWSANLQNIGTSFGTDIHGKPTDKLDVGVSLSHSLIADKFKQKTSDPATYSVPDISTELSNMRLFARYALRKNFSLHLDYILNRFKTDEWTWNHWTYADGTQLTQDTHQIVSFIGFSGHYTWQ
ncbi:MAG: MtrB/PioB family decaheme-associated outer membrane protein [Nitrosomonas sp.]|nr:MAG: MtrB/PioB family decaheme-associated outer membrane protein [Nitrosomonas sp.]